MVLTGAMIFCPGMPGMGLERLTGLRVKRILGWEMGAVMPCPAIVPIIEATGGIIINIRIRVVIVSVITIRTRSIDGATGAEQCGE